MPERVDLVLRPNPSAALLQTDAAQTWGGVVIFRKLPVDPSENRRGLVRVQLHAPSPDGTTDALPAKVDDIFGR